MISLEQADGFPPNLSEYIIWPSLRADKVLVTLTLFSRSEEDLEKMNVLLKMRNLMSHCLDCHQTCKD